MSNYYGYKCQTCGKQSPRWFNHGEEFLADFLKVADELNQAMKPLRRWVGWQIAIEFPNIYDCPPDPLEFIAEHEGHDVVVVDEYGRIWESKPL